MGLGKGWAGWQARQPRGKGGSGMGPLAAGHLTLVAGEQDGLHRWALRGASSLTEASSGSLFGAAPFLAWPGLLCFQQVCLHLNGVEGNHGPAPISHVISHPGEAHLLTDKGVLCGKNAGDN